jgi:SAM-dependent methyltransferase
MLAHRLVRLPGLVVDVPVSHKLRRVPGDRAHSLPAQVEDEVETAGFDHMSTSQQEQEQRRHRGYELAEVSYTDRRYGHAAMQMYAQIRTHEICAILDRQGRAGGALSLLDVGCGTGVTLCGLAAQRRSLKLCGVDFSEAMLTEARRRLAAIRSEAELVLGSAFDLPFADNSFDVVCSTRFIHQYSDDLKMKILKEMRRCLKPGGIAVVEFYSFFPWLLRYPLARARSAREHFLHCTSRKRLCALAGQPVEVVPLMVLGCTRLARIVGLKGVTRLRTLSRACRASFLFDQYLAVWRKD